MNFSAARSRSAVVAPGRTLPASRSTQRTRMSPARALLSSSAGGFSAVTALEPPSGPQRRERRTDVVVRLTRAASAVEAPQQAALVVVVDERLGLGVVGLQPGADLVRVVVVAQEQRLAALV